MNTLMFCAHVALLSFVASPFPGEKTVITRHPAWSYENYRRVAVVPFGVSSRDAIPAADRVGDRVVHLLSRNGAFTVFSRGDLQAVLTEEDLSHLSDGSDPATAIPAGRVQTADALVVGRVTEFALVRERVDRRVPRPLVDAHGHSVRDRYGRPVILSEELVPIFRHEARVAASVRVVNAATGEVLFSQECGPIVVQDEAEGGPPRRSAESLADEAADRLASEICASLSPLSLTVKLHSDSLIVASGFFDGKYDKIDKVQASSGRFLVVVRELPAECDRNRFRIAVALDDAKQNAIERDFVYEHNDGPRGVEIEIPVAELLPLVKDRKAKFYVKLYNGRDTKPLLDRSFKLYREE